MQAYCTIVYSGAQLMIYCLLYYCLFWCSVDDILPNMFWLFSHSA